ncbi:hypothetical protein BST81_04630 [Leptolyngbya sp. 'hensonii']|nr:hypothetical protein BST81_04630 [Leptolyngbya sp. 'hensonii']
MSAVEEILNFWLGDPQEADYGKGRKVWFRKDPVFDRLIRDQFQVLYEQAAAGDLDNWVAEPRSCLALLILLDQFPRNMFRGTPQAFATDAKALALAQTAIERRYDRQLLPIQRWFVYLPFEHSENLEYQHLAVVYFQRLAEEHTETAASLSSTLKHREIIERFGRFPHRNAILGRTSTAEELEFLNQPGSSF